MGKAVIDVPPKGGFSFDLYKRNAMLSKDGVQLPPFTKTGTTIVGLIFQVQLLSTLLFISNLLGQIFLCSRSKDKLLEIFFCYCYYYFF